MSGVAGGRAGAVQRARLKPTEGQEGRFFCSAAKSWAIVQKQLESYPGYTIATVAEIIWQTIKPEKTIIVYYYNLQQSSSSCDKNKMAGYFGVWQVIAPVAPDSGRVIMSMQYYCFYGFVVQSVCGANEPAAVAFKYSISYCNKV